MVRSSCGRNTRPRCKPSLALLSSSRLRLQLVAHYFIHPESEQRIPDSLLAPEKHSPLPVRTACRCVQSSLCPVYRPKKKKVSSAIHVFLTHARLCFYLCEDTTNTSAFLQTRRQRNYLRSGRICLMDLQYISENDRSKFKSDWNGLLRWGGEKKDMETRIVMETLDIKCLVYFDTIEGKMWALYFVMD